MKSYCHTCIHFQEAPYDAPVTGCYHPDYMQVKQKERYLDEQQTPGDHRKINLLNDCPKHEPRPAKAPFWKRLLAG